MPNEIDTHTLCPAHLRHIQVGCQEAAEIADRHVTSIWRACEDRRIRGLRWPAGSQKHWHIRLGDLVAYMGRPLSEEHQRQIESRLREADWL